jgi:hypothetical protein
MNETLCGQIIRTRPFPWTYGPVDESMFASIHRWMPTRSHPLASHQDGYDMVQ